MTNIYLTMAMSQLDGFLCKFNELLHSGKNAQLEVISKAGKAEIKLTTENWNPSKAPCTFQKWSCPAAAVVIAEEPAAVQHEDGFEVEEALGPTICNQLLSRCYRSI